MNNKQLLMSFIGLMALFIVLSFYMATILQEDKGQPEAKVFSDYFILSNISYEVIVESEPLISQKYSSEINGFNISSDTQEGLIELSTAIENIGIKKKNYNFVNNIKYIKNSWEKCNGQWNDFNEIIVYSCDENITEIRNYKIKNEEYLEFVIGHELGHAVGMTNLNEYGQDWADNFAYFLTGKGEFGYDYALDEQEVKK